MNRNSKKYVIGENDGEIFDSKGQPISREELTRRHEAKKRKKEAWEHEMSVRKDQVRARDRNG